MKNLTQNTTKTNTTNHSSLATTAAKKCYGGGSDSTQNMTNETPQRDDSLGINDLTNDLVIQDQ